MRVGTRHEHAPRWTHKRCSLFPVRSSRAAVSGASLWPACEVEPACLSWSGIGYHREGRVAATEPQDLPSGRRYPGFVISRSTVLSDRTLIGHTVREGWHARGPHRVSGFHQPVSQMRAGKSASAGYNVSCHCAVHFIVRSFRDLTASVAEEAESSASPRTRWPGRGSRQRQRCRTSPATSVPIR
jgi:hypothetical protein